VKIEIKHRFSGATLFECELPAEIAEQSSGRQLGHAIKEALKAGAYLADADLAGADLAGANLAGAYLAGAYLARANLAGAYLARADLAGANLAGAYLAGAYLARADLAGADLAGAYLAGAYLAGAYLAGANLAGAYLARADLAGADLAGAYLAGARNMPTSSEASPEVTREQFEEERKRPRWEREQRRAERYRARNPDVPVIPAIDQQILQAIERGGTLDMGRWHVCETTHCRAGWAITLAGDKGVQLELQHGPATAGRMIYTASAGYCPHFFAGNEAALEDIKARAAEQAAQS
jgi:hypothetical protein